MTLPENPLDWAVKAFRNHKTEDYIKYQEYIDGIQPLEFATEKFRSAFSDTFATFAYNRCEMAVSAHTDRLEVEGFGANNDTVAQIAQDIWDDNLMDVREAFVMADAIGLGDSYVIAEVHPERGGIHHWVQDPRSIRVHYSDEVPGELDLAAKTWVDERGTQRLNLYFADRIQKFVSKTKVPGGMPNSATSFETYDLDGDWEFRLNVTDTVPVFPFANNARTNQYGRSELRNVIPLQDAINKSVMDMLVAMEFAAFPQRVLIGVDDDSDEGMAKLARFQSGVDRMMTLFSPDAKLGEFSAANIAQYLGVIEFFDKTISRTTRIPVHYLGMDGGFRSGRERIVAETPFVAKVENRQRQFGQRWSDLMRYSVRLDGTNVAPGEIRVNWKSAAPLSTEDEIDLALQKQLLGFPFEALLREMGYEPDQIAAVVEEKARAADQVRRQFDMGDVVDDEDEVEIA